MKDYSEFLRILKQASVVDIFIVSFLLLPFILQAWVEVLSKLSFTDCQKFWTVALVVFLYIIGVVGVLYVTNRSKQREIAKNQIIGYLQSKELNLISFERIRERINLSYSDKFLESLTSEFPQELRRAKLKQNRQGLGRIVMEEGGDE